MRYLRFNGWLDEMVSLAERLDVIYFEEVRRHSSTDAAHVYGGFLSHLTAWCEKHTIPYQGVPVVVTYHPAYLLRNPADKGKAWADLVLALKTVQG